MIYAELTGGLGNQMFVYAFARALGLRSGEEVTLLDRQDWKDGGPAHTALALQSLAIAREVAILNTPQFAKNNLPVQNALKVLMIQYEQRRGLLAQDWQGFERRMAPALNHMGLHFATDGYIPVHRAAHPKNFLAWGYFQAEAYFADAADVIRKELRTKPGTGGDLAGRQIAGAIAGAQCPVCLHWRCGDYQKPENAALQVCNDAYYANACALLKAECPDAMLFVFSDDLDYVRRHLDSAGLPVQFAVGARSGAEELALMQHCRHFIISNSTFSWWAQYLGDAPDKIVYAPGRWYANDKHSALYSSNWQLIEV